MRAFELVNQIDNAANDAMRHFRGGEPEVKIREGNSEYKIAEVKAENGAVIIVLV